VGKPAKIALSPGVQSGYPTPQRYTFYFIYQSGDAGFRHLFTYVNALLSRQALLLASCYLQDIGRRDSNPHDRNFSETFTQ